MNINTLVDLECDFVLNKIKQKINEDADIASIYLDMRINSIFNKYTKFEIIDEIKLFTSLLKKRGFDKQGDLFNKDFILIQLISNKGYISQINIKHDIPKMKTNWFIIKTSFLSNLMISLNYFERI